MAFFGYLGLVNHKHKKAPSASGQKERCDKLSVVLIQISVRSCDSAYIVCFECAHSRA